MIKSYEKDGAQFWRVRIHARSKIVRGVEVDLTRGGLRSAADARKAEKDFEKKAAHEIFKRETRGLSWLKLRE